MERSARPRRDHARGHAVVGRYRYGRGAGRERTVIHNPVLLTRYSHAVTSDYHREAAKERLARTGRLSLRSRIAKRLVAFGEWLEPGVQEVDRPANASRLHAS